MNDSNERNSAMPTIPPYAHVYDALEFDPPTNLVTPPAVVPAVVPVVMSHTSSARDLAVEEAAIARDHGFEVNGADDGTFYAAGTKLDPIGEETLRRAEEQYRALPTLTEAATEHESIVKREERKDALVNLIEFRIDPNGDLRRIIQGTSRVPKWDDLMTPLSVHAHGQLNTRVGGGNINKSLASKTTPDQVRLRLRNAPESKSVVKREAYAIVGAGRRGFQPYDSDQLLWQVAKMAPDMKCEVSYDQDTTTMRARCISANAPIDIPSFTGVGRVHRVGFDVWTADNGTMSMRIGGFLMRVRCKNATMVTHGHRAMRRFRHVGALASLNTGISETLAAVNQATRELVDLWSRKAVEHYLDPDGARLSPPEAITRLVMNEMVPRCGLSAEDAIERYIAAWEAEEVYSAAGVIMAIQRASHESTWRTKWADNEIESSATELLYNHVLTLPEP